MAGPSGLGRLGWRAASRIPDQAARGVGLATVRVPQSLQWKRPATGVRSSARRTEATLDGRTVWQAHAFAGVGAATSPLAALPDEHGTSSSAGDEQEGAGWSVTQAGSALASDSNQQRADLHLVLVAPLIPGNVGTVARTCAAAAVGLHLVEPLGFEISDTKLKRAGLDYWPFVVVKVHRSWEDFHAYFLEQAGPKRLVAFSKRGSIPHWDVAYRPGDWLLFGSETSGLPPAAVSAANGGSEHSGGIARIPMEETHVRSLNLAVSASVGVYEAMRQLEQQPKRPQPKLKPSSLSS
eukprot:TRINITY_DN1714_c0_g1_i3.p1 TRINITY_DN1714_c0_g1~~TRINITY_DN1714_c0_g1_i3.p1  ORF type:complete len:295 (-),score=42.48 TRINITY_DN1714_c0_g1_i3:174-1058(-)